MHMITVDHIRIFSKMKKLILHWMSRFWFWAFKLKKKKDGEVGGNLIWIHNRYVKREMHKYIILGFHKLDEIDNIGIRDFTTWKSKNPATKCYLQWGLNLKPLIPSLTLSFLS